MGLANHDSVQVLIQKPLRWAFFLGVVIAFPAGAEVSQANRSPAVVSGSAPESMETANPKGGFYPPECSYPRNLFQGSDWETQRENYDRTMAEVDRCKGGVAFVHPVGDGNDWKVICTRDVRGEYVMNIPESIRNSGKRYTVHNRTGKGSLFALDKLPASSAAAGAAAYFSSVCTENATVNFNVQDCKTLSFNPADYRSGKTAQAFLIDEAERDCKRIANKVDVADSQKRLINRKVLSHLQGCRR
jgi:hypothetical protein